MTILSMTIHVKNKVLSGNGAIVKKELNQGKDVSIVKPDILTSTVKPNSCSLLIEVLPNWARTVI